MDVIEGMSASPGENVAHEVTKSGKTWKVNKFVTLWQVIFVTVAVSILASAGSVAVYDRYYAQKIAVLDTSAFLKRQKALFIAKEITGDELLKSEEIIYEFIDSIGSNIVLLNKEAVIKNGKTIAP